jgi:hypothetical protein
MSHSDKRVPVFGEERWYFRKKMTDEVFFPLTTAFGGASPKGEAFAM